MKKQPVNKITRITLDFHNLPIKDLSKHEITLVAALRQVLEEERTRKAKIRDNMGRVLGEFKLETVKVTPSTED